MIDDRQSGTVKWFDNKKGYGFIVRDNEDEDIFVHYREIRGQGYRTLNEGQKVEFTLNKSDKGLAAQDVDVEGDEEEGGAPPPVAN